MPTPSSTSSNRSLEDALAAARSRAELLENENAELLSQLEAARAGRERAAAGAGGSSSKGGGGDGGGWITSFLDRVLDPPPGAGPAATPAAASSSASRGPQPTPPAAPSSAGFAVDGGELEERLAAVGAALWEGARRTAELAAERQQLIDRCERAEAAACTARDACQRLATKLAAALGVEDGQHNNGSGDVHTPAAPLLSAAATPRSAGLSSVSREALVARGRSAFEAHLRSAALRGAKATPIT